MNTMLKTAFAVLLALLSPHPLLPQHFSLPRLVSSHDFAIMPWDHAPTDPELLRGIKEAGMNIAGFCRPEDVEYVRAAGLGCILRDSQLAEYDWDSLPPEGQIRKDIADLARRYRDDPTVLGFFLSDEPQITQMKSLGHVVSRLREAMPNKLPYINLFPYREGQQRWYSDYEQYARGLVEIVHQPFLSFDNYSLSGGEMGDEFFTNLEYVREVGLESNTPFWSCVLAVAHFGYMEPSNATFNLQAYSTLAYGGRGIQYFTYFTPERGNYRLGAIDQFGNKTPTWDMLRHINYQIRTLVPVMKQLHSTGVYHYPDVPKQGKPLSESRLVRWISMVKDEDQYVKPSVQARFLVGEFQDDLEHSYLMLVNKDLEYSFRFDIVFKSEVHKIWKISPYSGKEEPFEGEENWLAPGGGILLRLE